MSEHNANSAGGWQSSLPLVIAGFAISFVVVGGGIETVGVFLNAISAANHWSRSSLSLGVSVGAVMAALSTPAVGVLVDRHGVRVPMTVGVALLFVGFVILMLMQQPWHFVAANVFLGPGFAACALLPLTIAVTILIPDRTTLALGIVAAGTSAGAFVLAPLLQAVIEATGWRNTYILMGSAVVLTPLPFIAFALPRGQLRSAAARDPQQRPERNPLHDLRQPGVGALAGVMVLPGLTAFSVSVHLVPYLTGLGRTGTAAAAALGAMVGISAIGKIGGGLLGDRLGALRTLRLALALDAIALVLLHYASASMALGGFITLYGLALGAQVAVIPAIAIGVLGAERFGTLFGLLQLATMLASAIGPVASGMIFDATGHYAGAIFLWLVALIAATVTAFWIPPAKTTVVSTPVRRAVA
ncbi:MAG: MFS transporter [Candidatus Binatia bacterium]